MKKPIVFLTLASLPFRLHADEFVYNAEVISAEPFTATRTLDRMPDHCTSGKPGTSFGALIEWDIGCEQPHEVEVTGYRVTYELQGERFVAFSDEQPGRTIPIRVNLN